MFGRSRKAKLQAKYNKLMQEAYDLSTVSRQKSDQKRAEAEEIGRQLDELEKQSQKDREAKR
ncbi:MAG: hypothetical protein KatS3mg111_3887 [Pirellulaceae bacterium]|nr:MAG: hypothetical protein KatS3mg111_3887 [Pirellulaceae bacterium]